MKSLAAVLIEINKPLELMDLEIPALKDGQVLVQISHSGICQTQLNEIHGFKGEDKFLPHTLGHEGSGVVLEVGRGVTKVKRGDNVVMTWIKGKGMEAPGTQYQVNGRAINSGAISTWMTHTVVSENRLVPIHDFPMDLASLLGCAIPTGAGIVLNTLKARPGLSVSIWGLGGIGLSALLAAKHQGLNPIIAVDIVESKLEMARSLGAHFTIDAKKEDAVSQILKMTSQAGCDYAIESAGKIATIEAAYASVRKGGGRLVVAGNPRKGDKFSVDPFDLIQGKQICGTWGGETDPDKDIPSYGIFFRNVGLEKLITHRFPLGKMNEATRLMESGQAGRIVIDMENIYGSRN